MTYATPKYAKHVLVALVTICLAAACSDDGNGGNNGGANNGGANNDGTNDAGTGDAGSDTGSTDTGDGNGQGLSASGELCENTAFSACGGDLAGTWSLSGGCVTPTALPYYQDCSASVAVSTSPSGDWVVEADGTYTVNNFMFDTELDATVPKSCLDSGQTCTHNPIDDEGVEAGDACELNYGHDIWLRDPGAYTVDETANTVELADEEGFAVASFEYCVEGDTLTLRQLDADDHEARLTLTRQ